MEAEPEAEMGLCGAPAVLFKESMLRWSREATRPWGRLRYLDEEKILRHSKGHGDDLAGRDPADEGRGGGVKFLRLRVLVVA